MDHIGQIGDCGQKECEKNAPHSQILPAGKCLSKAGPYEHTADRMKHQRWQMKRLAVESKQFE